MLKNIGKYIFMIELGYKYIRIFKKTFFHPFISLKPAYQQLSIARQAYSNSVLEFLNIEVKVIGKIPQRDKILYAINHRSLLDMIVMENIFSKYHKNGTWIAKEELFTAIYGDFFKYSGCISVDIEHGKGLLKFFKQIKKTLAKVDDINIYIFPEGERNKQDTLLPFQNGASKIAIANNLDVIPVFINDRLEEIFKNAPYKDKKTVEVHIGEPIDAKNLENEYSNFMKNIKGNK
ncbi:1-acyl-sn-glycerol-3-phosphate acyltransferase [Epsilonproteobacteria bacterium SCGC AD-308-P11]|jgi:1-acyl-sn-glycerol-3-phosphate acyltransferase|nr:1-acyl-sn-glycerol-3-phosphate acyltransferase [Epsilonproteobacteria bacterium SCGC AD-308-P11]